METLDSLRAERDDAREKCVAILINELVDAHACYDLPRILHLTTAVASCPYPLAQRCLVGLAVANFLVGCAFVDRIGCAKEEGEVLFDATKKAA
jgi:hypothetical protein